MKLHLIEPNLIRVRGGLERIRKEYGNIRSLADSIKKIGQIQPIIVTKRTEGGSTQYYDIVVGERRLLACIEAKCKVLCVLRGDLNEFEMRELEIEENFKRKQFTPAEELEAVRILHGLKIKEHGQAVEGSLDSGWRISDTASILGISRTNVIEKLKLAEVVNEFPELKKQKKMKDIKRAVKGLTKVIQRQVALTKHEATVSKNDTSEWIKVSFASDFLGDMKDNSADLVLTDPPYGIEINKLQDKAGGSGFTYEDGYLQSLKIIDMLASESFRVTKENGHAYIFFAPEFYEIVKRSFVNAGWLTNHRPIIWIKNESGQTNQPEMWPAACYEMCFYFRKSNSKLVIEGRSDWIQEKPVSPSNRIHPSQKPIPLLQELIRRTCLPGAMLLDPFMGSGSALIAGFREKLIVRGCDKEIECYNMTKEALILLKKMEENNG